MTEAMIWKAVADLEMRLGNAAIKLITEIKNYPEDYADMDDSSALEILLDNIV